MIYSSYNYSLTDYSTFPKISSEKISSTDLICKLNIWGLTINLPPTFLFHYISDNH